MKSENLAVGSTDKETAERIEKEMNRPDPKVSEKIRKQIAFLKLYDPEFKDILPFKRD